MVKILEASAARLASNGSALVLHIFGNKDLFLSSLNPIFAWLLYILRKPPIQACSASSYGSKQPFPPLNLVVRLLGPIYVSQLLFSPEGNLFSHLPPWLLHGLPPSHPYLSSFLQTKSWCHFRGCILFVFLPHFLHLSFPSLSFGSIPWPSSLFLGNFFEGVF